MKKTIFLIFITLLLLPCFAERKTRVDSYGHQQIKIIWNTNYTLGPDGTNWAKDSWGSGWTKALRYDYILNPKNTANNISRATITLYTNDNAGYCDYKYAVIVYAEKDGLTELVSRTDYYDFAYNQAKIEFDDWVNIHEYFVSF